MAKRYVRTYDLDHEMNPGKADSLGALLDVWNPAMTLMKGDKIADLRRGGKIRDFLKEEWDLWDPKIYGLTARHAKSVESQLNGQLRSWQEGAVAEGRKVINELHAASPMSDAELKRLRTINKSKDWWSDPITTKIIEIVLLRKPFPVFKGNPTAVLGGLVIDKQDAEHKGKYSQWLDVLGMREQEHILIPLDVSGYSKNALSEGRELRSYQVKRVDGKITLKQCVEYEKSEARESKGREVGLDWGLTTMLTTSDGDLLGRSMYEWLLARDAELMALEKRLKRQGVKLSESKRYRNIQKRIRAYVDNEVSRILNKLAEDTTISTLVIEDLDFRHGGLSKQMNRLVSRAGRSTFSAKIKELEETRGIANEKVNPAYTSQQCDGCGYVHKSNRKGVKFICRFCGKKMHADISGARTVLLRRSQGKQYLFITRTEILRRLDAEFSERWGTKAPARAATQDTPKSRRASGINTIREDIQDYEGL